MIAGEVWPRRAVWLAVLAGALGLQEALATPAADSLSFTLELSVRHQTMDNFGANDAWYLQGLDAWAETNKQRIAELLFSTNKGIGLSAWRFYVGAGLNHQSIRDPWRTLETFEVAPGEYDWSRQASGRWFLRAAKAHGVRQFLATVYSPPPRLTRNGLSNLGSDTNSTTNLKPGGEDEFARYVTDILRHFRDNPDDAERIDFDYVLPVNEPQWDWQRGQEGNRASNADLKRIFGALARQLKAAGLNTRILGPESGSIPGMYSLETTSGERWQAVYGDYLNLICGDPAMSTGFGNVISYHSYWSDRIPEELIPHRERLAQAAARFPQWKLWQSEYCVMEHGRDLGMDTALRVARIIHCDLTVVNASAWQWWLAFAGENYKSGLIYTDYKRAGDRENILESKTLWALGHYSRFIRPGMVRIGCAGPQDIHGVMASAFLEPGSGRVVVVFVNVKSQAREVRLRVANSGAGTGIPGEFSVFTTSAKQNLQAGRPVRVPGSFSLPGSSVVTVVGQIR